MIVKLFCGKIQVVHSAQAPSSGTPSTSTSAKAVTRPPVSSKTLAFLAVVDTLFNNWLKGVSVTTMIETLETIGSTLDSMKCIYFEQHHGCLAVLDVSTTENSTI